MDVTVLSHLAEEHEERKRELEKAHEELQSTNEELETSNELDRVNLFLEGILANLGVGVVVLDPSLNVEVWDGDSVELWGLRAEEVEGKAFSSLEIGLPVAEMEGAVRLALGSRAQASSVVLDVVDRRGRGVQVLGSGASACYVWWTGCRGVAAYRGSGAS